MRPTGKLHLGNYLGALANWVTPAGRLRLLLLRRPTGTCSPTDADGQRRRPGATRSRWSRTGSAPGSTPSARTLFIQSLVPEHAELHLLFSMVHAGGLARARADLQGDGRAAGHRVAVVRAARLSAAAVGRHPHVQGAAGCRWASDQVPHVELTREVARRFNNTLGAGVPGARRQADRDPEGAGHRRAEDVASPTATPSICPTPPRRSRAKIKPMMTDPARKRRTDPGNPDICPVFDLHRIFTPRRRPRGCATGCRTAGIGCLDCKDVLLKHMLPPLARDPRAAPGLRREARPTIVEILHEGSRRARAVAQRDDGRGARDAVQAGRHDDDRRRRRRPHRCASSRSRARSTCCCTSAAPTRSTSPRCRCARSPTSTWRTSRRCEFRISRRPAPILVMAATLIYLKSKLLVPARRRPDEEQLDDEALAAQAGAGGAAARVRAGQGARRAGSPQREAEQALLWGRPSSDAAAARGRAARGPLACTCSSARCKRLIEEQKRAAPARGRAEPALGARAHDARSSSLLRDTWSLLFSSVAGGERDRAEWW